MVFHLFAKRGYQEEEGSFYWYLRRPTKWLYYIRYHLGVTILPFPYSQMIREFNAQIQRQMKEHFKLMSDAIRGVKDERGEDGMKRLFDAIEQREKELGMAEDKRNTKELDEAVSEEDIIQ